jgi:hypothetical protein
LLAHLSELVAELAETLVPLLSHLVSVEQRVAVTPLVEALLSPPEHVDATGDEDEEKDDEKVHLLLKVQGSGFRVQRFEGSGFGVQGIRRWTCCTGFIVCFGRI